MKFTPVYFPPPGVGTALADGGLICRLPPADPVSTYVYDDKLVLAVNVALATGRPLLLAGEPGSGKTTLARNVALAQDWADYRYTVHSRSQASELLWDVDTLRRLNDAYDAKRELLDEDHYVEPGVLWWALAPKSAALRGLQSLPDDEAPKPPRGHRDAAGAVLLIDEIDKAEPDVPNDLLEVLDTRRFAVRGREIEPERTELLVIITTNLERDLPGAFMRRCIVHRLPEARPPWFTDIAAQHLPAVDAALAREVESRLMVHRNEAIARGTRPPGTAEYLDALRALVALKVTDRPTADGSAAWDLVERSIFGKEVK